MAEKNCITFVWAIENFNYSEQEKSEKLESPEFHVHSLMESKWKLHIYPRGKGEKNEVRVYLQNVSCGRENPLFIDFEASFISGNSTVLLNVKKEDIEFESGGINLIFQSQTMNEIIEMTDKFLQNTMTIQCRIWKSKNNLTQSTTYFARTRIGLQKQTFCWTVTEFIKSRVYPIKRVPDILINKEKLTLILETSLYMEGIYFEIIRFPEKVSKLFMTGKVSVLDTKGTIVKCVKGFHFFKLFERCKFFSTPLTKEMTENAEIMVDDTINLLIDLTFSTGVEYSKIESVYSVPTWVQEPSGNTTGIEEIPIRVSSNKFQSLLDNQKGDKTLVVLQEDLLFMYTDKTLSDFELRTGSKSIPVHKSVLAARSSVFKAMFTSGMKEGADNFLDIPDLDEDTLDKLLVFVYTGNVEELDLSGASNLYYAADKYGIISLKQMCCTCLTNSIEESNVCEILILADRHNDEGLKSSIHEFIMSNDKAIIGSAKWKKFLAENAKLAAETLQLIYSKKMDIITK